MKELKNSPSSLLYQCLDCEMALPLSLHKSIYAKDLLEFVTMGWKCTTMNEIEIWNN